MSKFTLQHSLHYSSYLACMYYSDFVANNDALVNSSRNGADYIVIGKLGDGYYKKTDLKNTLKKDLVELFYHHDVGYDASGYTKTELIYELLQVTNKDYYASLYNNQSWRELSEYDFVASGYSQGNSCKVLVLDKKEYPYIDNEYISNILYSQPMSGTIELYYDNNLIVELYIDEYIDSYNYYDKQDLIDNIKKQYMGLYKDALFNLLDTLPDQIDYN